MNAVNQVSAPLLTGTLEPRNPTQAARTQTSVRGEWPIAILGVPFDHVTIDGAIERIDEMIASRQPHYVVTANVDFLVQANRDVELRRILLDADLVLCDGTPVAWASRWLGNPLPERVAGSDLAPQLIQHAAKKGHRIFFLGAAPGVAHAAADRLRAQFPTLNIVGHYAPPFAALLDMDHEQIARRVREAKPDILLVSFGCPKQEKWIAMHHRTLGVPVAIGVGATIDFLAGRVKRAPEWMRRSGTEWIYRLLLEPRRLFRRYAADLVYFLPTLASQCLALASRDAGRIAARDVPLAVPDWSGVAIGDGLTRAAIERDAEFWHELTQRDSHCVADVSQVEHIDGTGIAFLVHWRKALRARERQLVLLAPSAKLRQLLLSLRLTDYFLIAQDIDEAARQADAIAGQSAVQRDGTTRSVAWCGEIVAANVDDVWQTTTSHVQAFVSAGATLVIIDLERLRFIDSSGAALMLRLTKWAQSLQAQILFSNAQENVRNVLRLTRLEHVLLEGAQ